MTSLLENWQAAVDTEVGTSPWVELTQADVDAHGATTGDTGPIHADVEWAAANTPFGGTLLQGSLMLSCLTQMGKSIRFPEGDVAFRLNYGFDRIRFIQPVPTGASIRCTFTVGDVAEHGKGRLRVRVDASIESNQTEGTAVAAEWIFLLQEATE